MVRGSQPLTLFSPSLQITCLKWFQNEALGKSSNQQLDSVLGNRRRFASQPKDVFSSDSQRDWNFLEKDGSSYIWSWCTPDAPFTGRAPSVYFLHNIRWCISAVMYVHCVSCLCAAREQELITCLLVICIKALHTVNVEYFEFRSSIFHQHFACAQVLRRIHCPCCLLKKIIHVMWPWRRIKKKNNSKKKYSVSKPSSETNMEAMKHAVQGENLETPVSGAETGKL